MFKSFLHSLKTKDNQETINTIIEAYNTLNPPKFLYHATLYKFLDSIQKHGLGATTPNKEFAHQNIEQNKPHVYLAENDEDAIIYVEGSRFYDEGETPEIALFRVNIKDLDLNNLKPDPNFTEDEQHDTYVYYGIIPANKLTLMD